MPHLLLFGPARELAGTRRLEVSGDTVAEVMATAVERFGPGFAEIAARSQRWVNGEEAADGTPTGADDEVALLPPVSGG